MLTGCSAAHASPGTTVTGSTPSAPPATTRKSAAPHPHPRPTSRPAPQPPPTFEVGYAQTTLVDPIDGGRTLVTTIRYPTLAGSAGQETTDATPARRYGPFPVIVFAHGYNVTPDTYKPLLDAWAEAGFVVVAPLFPKENEYYVSSVGGPGTAAGAYAEDDEFNEPYDLAYLIKVIAADYATPADGPASVLFHLADPHDLILAGQSDGGDVVAAFAYDSAFASTWASVPVADRPHVVAIFEGAEFERGYDHYGASAAGSSPIALVVQSATDACNAPQDSIELYGALSPPKRFLELDNATHLGPYDGTATVAPLVERLTAGFFDHWLDEPWAESAARLWAEADVTGEAALSEGATAPYMAPLEPSSAACAP
jgi:hypothetical protein